MSSLFPGPNVRGPADTGPAINAFRRRVEAEARPDLEEIAGLTPQRRIQLAGGSSGQQRMAQQQQRFDAAQTAADIYGLQTERSRGPVGTLFDFLGRGQSGVTGAVTGLLGLEREGEVNRGPSLSEAARRFGQGVSGEEKYFFSEFTDTGRRIARGEDVGKLAKGWNTALGFVIDTALDPITYLSFGGSIMGRMRAANAIRGSAQRAVTDLVASPTFNARNFLEDSLRRNVIRMDELIGRVNRMQDDFVKAGKGFKKSELSVRSTLDDISRLSSQKLDVDFMRELSLELVPEAAGMAYARGGRRNLQKWAASQFGDEAGEAYIRSLPLDLQGGVRLRLPFVRRADGTPIAIGVSGIGVTKAEKYVPGLEKINNLTQAGRDWLREAFERPLGALAGSSGDLYYDAVINAAGRRNFSKSGGSSWVTYQGKLLADSKRAELRGLFDEVYLKRHEITASLYRQAEQKHGAEFRDWFRRYFYNTDELTAARNNRQNLTETQLAAYNTANSWREMLDEIGQDAVETFGDADLAFTFLSDYVPRVRTLRERSRQALKGQKRGEPGAVPQWTKHRGRWAQQWKIEEGRARVARWAPNEDVNKLAGDEVYSTDPTDFMTSYLADVRHALNDQKVLNFMRREGLLTQAETAKLRLIDETETQRRMLELAGMNISMLDDGTFEPGIARSIREKLLDPSFNYNPSQALTDEEKIVGNAMAAYLSASGRSWQVDILTIDDIHKYVRTEDGRLVNLLDGTFLRRARDGRFKVYDSDGAQVTFSGGTPAAFSSVEEAQEVMRNSFGAAREDAYYRNYLPAKKQEVLDDIDSLFTQKEFANLHMNVFGQLSDGEKTAYVEKWLRTLDKFGMAKSEAIITESGNPAYKAGMGTQPLVRWVQETTEDFKDYIVNFDLTTIDGLRFDAAGNVAQESTVLVKSKIAQQLVNVYAPAKMMEAVQKMFSVSQKPQTFAGELIEKYYKPIYAIQKAWMTLGRGPGFVMRNMLGGAWNNSLAGVGVQHTSRSAKVIIARMRAQKAVQQIQKSKGTLFDPMEIAELYQQNMRRELGRSFDDATVNELMDAWEAFSRNGLAGNRESAALYGQILRGLNREGRSRGFGSRRRNIGGYRVRIRENTGSIDMPTEIVLDDDLSRAERILERMTDNWWISDVMSPMVERSEDYMRFAAFLKGVQEVGLEPERTGVRGYAASAWVRTTQFDYADLSDFEQSLKMIVPFWTWTRYNVPLQIRAMIHQPGRVATALRFHESLGKLFDEDEDAISPSYIADRFGITIPEEKFEMLPEWMRPKGDVTLNLTYGEPLADINELFRDPTFPQRDSLKDWLSPGQVVNIRAAAQNLNPIIAAVSEAQRAFSEGSAFESRNVEEAPGWARALGLAREDPTEPGKYIVSRPLMEFFRNVAPPVGLAERLIPWVGGERSPGRWTTSVVSSLFGLPVATTDDWKKASAMQQQADFIQKQMKGEFGPEWEYRNELISRLLQEGAPVEFIESLNMRDMENDEVDVLRAVHTWRMLRRVELLIEGGVPEDEIVAGLSAYVPEGSQAESLLQLIWKYVPKPSTDFSTGARTFGLKPVSRSDLEALGLTVNDVRNMSENEQRQLIYLVNRNRGWQGPTT